MPGVREAGHTLAHGLADNKKFLKKGKRFRNVMKLVRQCKLLAPNFLENKMREKNNNKKTTPVLIKTSGYCSLL